ncbi:MAG: Clp protease [Actinobacteria bacterium 13_2_20CM_2_71_6]|nr:MAG: Clp protease [Actinobacteria bacterium 13_2_20CM_2_71_6]
MFERFTNQARHVVKRAHDEAEGLHHRYIGTEHLLLAMLDPDSGLAHTVLAGAGVTRERVRAAVEAKVGQGGLGDDDAAALKAIGIDLPAVRAKIEELFGPGALDPPDPEPRRGLLRRRRTPQGPTNRIPFAARSKKVLELSLREALRLGHNYIGSEHILLGLIREGEGLAAQILVESGVSLDDLRARTMAALNQAA